SNLDSFLCFLASLSFDLLKCFGLSIISLLLSASKFLIPRSIPTSLFVFLIGSFGMLSQTKQTYHLFVEDLIIIQFFIVPLIFLCKTILIFPILESFNLAFLLPFLPFMFSK